MLILPYECMRFWSNKWNVLDEISRFALEYFSALIYHYFKVSRFAISIVSYLMN